MQPDRRDAQRDGREHRRNNAENPFPEINHVQPDVRLIIPVHNEAVADDHGNRRAQRAADPAELHAQRNADDGVADGHTEINLGAELVHVFRALDFNADVLNQRHRHRADEQQRNPIGRGVFRAAPRLNKRHADEDEARQHEHQQHELDAPDARKQPRELLIPLPARNDAVDLRGEHAGDRRGQRHVILVDLRAHAVNRRRRRAADDAQQRRIHRPVDLVDDFVEEDEERETRHVAQQPEIELAEGDAHAELFNAVPDAHRVADRGQDQRDQHQRDGAVPHQQQRQHHNRVEHRAQHADQPLEQEALLRRDIGKEHARRERRGDVDNQQRHQDLGGIQLLRRQLRGENIFDVGDQHAARQQAQQADGEEDRHKHAVDPRHAVLAVLRLRAGIIAHVGAAHAEGEQAQVGDKAVHQRIQAVFALPQQPQHHRRIGERNQGGEDRLPVTEQHARFLLVHSE